LCYALLVDEPDFKKTDRKRANIRIYRKEQTKEFIEKSQISQVPFYVSLFPFHSPFFAFCFSFYCLFPLFCLCFLLPFLSPLPFHLCGFIFVSVFQLLWVSSVAYPNLLGTKRHGCYCTKDR
jgi:hypothetical protein